MATATAQATDIRRETRGMTPLERARYILSARTTDGRRVYKVWWVPGGIEVTNYAGQKYLVNDDGECDCPATVKCWHRFIIELIASRYEHDEPAPWVCA